MKILLLGCNGQAGWELQRSLAPLGELTALGRQEHGGLCGDLSDPDSLAVTLKKLAPDVTTLPFGASLGSGRAYICF